MTAADSLNCIRDRYRWPEHRPAVAEVRWTMDYGGRRLITDLLASRRLMVVLEVGTFLGGSARQWLTAGPELVVVCIDPWADIVRPNPWFDRHPFGRACGGQLRAAEGLYETFLSSMWDVRDRVIPVRGKAADKLPELHALGLKPDLVYIDADKRCEEIAVCDVLFPDALIGGDDWNWSDGYAFPSRAPARASARKRGRVLKHCGNTWLIDDRSWTVGERILQMQSLPRGICQTSNSLIRRLRGQTSTGAPRAARPRP